MTGVVATGTRCVVQAGSFLGEAWRRWPCGWDKRFRVPQAQGPPRSLGTRGCETQSGATAPYARPHACASPRGGGCVRGGACGRQTAAVLGQTADGRKATVALALYPHVLERWCMHLSDRRAVCGPPPAHAQARQQSLDCILSLSAGFGQTEPAGNVRLVNQRSLEL